MLLAGKGQVQIRAVRGCWFVPLTHLQGTLSTNHWPNTHFKIPGAKCYSVWVTSSNYSLDQLRIVMMLNLHARHHIRISS